MLLNSFVILISLLGTNAEINSPIDLGYSASCAVLPPSFSPRCQNDNRTVVPRAYNPFCDITYDYPWQVALVKNPLNKNGDTDCGGTLINERFVLTAAHCVEAMKPGDISVILGERDRLKNEGTEVIMKIAEIIIHDSYSYGIVNITMDRILNKNFNDIALLRLEHNVMPNNDIKLACLPQSEPKVGSIAFASGWGSTLNGDLGSTKLLHVSTEIMDRNTCKEIWEHMGIFDRSFVINSKHLCIKNQHNHGLCKGDSGGGLIVNDEGKATVVGVVSFGKVSLLDYPKICNESYPQVFTNVVEYVPWILEKINLYP